MNIFELFMDPIVYIRFITQFSPILFSFLAVIDSAYNMSLKGIMYVFGVIISMFFGKLLSASFPFRVPGIEDGMKETEFATSQLKSDKYAFENPKFHPSCNLISKPDHAGWGTFYSSPDMYSLFYSFTLIYIITSMLNNNDFNLFILSILLFFFLLSSYFRTNVFYCVQFRDILIGMVIGSLIGFLWFMFISVIEKSLKIYDLTYFNNNKENNNKCKMKNKQFRCKKIKTNIEKDNQINKIKIESNLLAREAIKASQRLDKNNNFINIWKLYKSILKKQINSNNNTKIPTKSLFNKDKIKVNLDTLFVNSVILDSIGNSDNNIINEIYGINKPNINITEKITNTKNIYLKNNDKNNYSYVKNNVFDTRVKKPTVKEVLNTNYYIFINFINNNNNKNSKIIKKINNKIEQSSQTEDKNNLPINILYNTVKTTDEYIELTDIILNSNN